MYRYSQWHHYREHIVNHNLLWQYNIIWGLPLMPLSHCHDSHQSQYHRENFDWGTAVTHSFKMSDAFAGERIGGALAQASSINVWQGRVWMSRRQAMHGLCWRVVVRANSPIVWSARCCSNSTFVYGDGAVTPRKYSGGNHDLTITQQTIVHVIVYRSHFELTLVEWNHLSVI